LNETYKWCTTIKEEAAEDYSSYTGRSISQMSYRKLKQGSSKASTMKLTNNGVAYMG